MANDPLENPFQNNFGIENTMEMGLGSAELLQGLYESESATGDPDDLEKITKEIDKDKIAPRRNPKMTELPGDKSEEEEDKDKPPSGEKLISDLLNSGDDDDEAEEDVAAGEIQPGQQAPETHEDEPASQFTALANDLFKLGVFSKDDDEGDVVISTPEQFLDRFNLEKKNGAIEMVNDFIGRFGEDYQRAFEAIYVKGANPKDYFGVYNNILNIAELDLAQEENQVLIMRQALTEQGFEPEDITTEIDRIKNYGDLEQVAMKHHKVLMKKEAAKLQQLERQAEQDLQQKNAIRAQWIQNVQTVLQEKVKTKEFDGIPINPKLANELQDFLLVDKYKTASGELLTDFDKTILELKRPENHATKVKVALLLKILEKDPTLSTIQRSGVTKGSEKLFESLARQTAKTRTPSSNQGKPNSWFQQ